MKRLFLFLAFFSIGVMAHADSVVFDTSTVWPQTNNGTPTKPTWNITIGNGTSAVNKVVFLACQYDWASSSSTISSATINGSGNAFIFAQRVADFSNQFGSELWYYVNPPTGSVSIQVNSLPQMNDNRQSCSVIDFAGVNQTLPLESSNTVSNSGSPASANLTITTANDWIINSFFRTTTGTPTGTNGQTVVLGSNLAGGPAGFAYAGPETVGTFADSYTFGSGGMSFVDGAIKPAPNAPAARGLFIHGRSVSIQ